MRRAPMSLLIFVTFAANAALTTDLSDLWYNPNESGWGVNVMQQEGILFITLFVYGTDNKPIWYVGPATARVGSSGFTFTGPLYQTTGPWFGTTFTPSNVPPPQVGTITFTAQTIETASLTYSVNGTNVGKAVTRQTWRANNLNGSYLGGTAGTYSGCSTNGYEEVGGVINVNQTNTTLTMTLQDANGGSCTYSGPYSQSGRMGSVAGTFACTGGIGGTFSAFEIEGNISGFTARGSVSFGGGCQWNGRLGGCYGVLKQRYPLHALHVRASGRR